MTSSDILPHAGALAVAVLIAVLALSPAYALDVDIGIRIGDKSPERAAPHAKGPPDHAPAHGYRAKHRYHYYPSSEVYFDDARGVYFYFSGHTWHMSARLPLNLKARLGEHVSLEMETDKPYTEHKSHKAKYPPGQMKHKDKHKDNHQR